MNFGWTWLVKIEVIMLLLVLKLRTSDIIEITIVIDYVEHNYTECLYSRVAVWLRRSP